MNGLKAWNCAVERGVYWITAGTAGVFFVVVLVSVASGLFHYPIQAKEELSSLFFVWSCFAGAALCYRREQHIKLVFLFERLSWGGQRILSGACHLIVLAFLGLVFVKSVEMIWLLRHATMPMSKISEVWLYLPLPVFSVAMISFGLEFLVRDWRALPDRGNG